MVDVRVVSVDVSVTDRSGAPISGLGLRDLRLLVDGVEVPIEYFNEIRAGAGSGETSEGGQGARSFLVLVDESLAIGSYRDAALRDIEQELSRLAPGDQMAVAAFDGRRVATLCAWTTDRPRIAAALQEAMRRRGDGIHQLVQQREAESTVEFLRDPFASEAGRGQGGGIAVSAVGRAREALADEDAEGREDPWHITKAADVLSGLGSPEVESQFARTGPALAAAFTAFAALDGRKVALLITGYWAITAGGRLHEIQAAANEEGFTVYPIDASVRDAGMLRYADLWAAETGGRALVAGLERSAFSQVAADTASYYLLGFTPRWTDVDARHSIRVEPRSLRWRVRTRRGVWTASRETAARAAARSVLLAGGAPESPRLRVEFGEPSARSGELAEVAMTVHVPPGLLLFQNVDGRLLADVWIAAAVEDDAGGRLISPGLHRKVVGDAALGGGRLRLDLTLGRRPQRVVVALGGVDRVFAWGEASLSP